MKVTIRLGAPWDPKMGPKSAFAYYYNGFLLLLDAHMAEPGGPGILDIPKEFQ